MVHSLATNSPAAGSAVQQENNSRSFFGTVYFSLTSTELSASAEAVLSTILIAVFEDHDAIDSEKIEKTMHSLMELNAHSDDTESAATWLVREHTKKNMTVPGFVQTSSGKKNALGKKIFQTIRQSGLPLEYIQIGFQLENTLEGATLVPWTLDSNGIVAIGFLSLGFDISTARAFLKIAQVR